LPYGGKKDYRMKILFITANLFTPQTAGGSQTSATELALRLKAQGHDVSVLSALMPEGYLGIRGKLMIKLLRRKAVMDNVLGFPVWRTWCPWDVMGWVASHLKPDLAIVLAREPVRMALAARAAGVPVLMMLQDVAFSDHGGDFSALGKVPCVANSQFTAERYRQAFGVEPVVILPLINGENYKTETTRENVTFINPHPIKGLDIAVAVAQRCPEIPFSFVEAWPMWPKDRTALEATLSQVPNITLHSTQRDMKNVYSKCKILLAPSTCEEAFGRVVAEAQFSGIPVIASSRGGLPEAVGPGGILLDPQAPIEDWVSAVKRLWSDDALYAELSAAARTHSIRPALKWENQLEQWEKMLDMATR
jgi:glycosyltransferase involved in cell wall biosynthesis